MLAVGGAAFAAFYFFQFIDARALGESRSPLEALFTHFDLETLQNSLANLSQVVAAVLGIAITVVAIVVQLAATRYTPRVTDLFFRDGTNLAVLGLFASSCLYTLWVSMTVGKGYLPVRAIGFGIVIVSASVLVLVPYFSYVFAFLEPERVIRKLELDALTTALRARRGQTLAQRQEIVLANLEHLADIAVNAVSQNDRIIATRACTALGDLVARYLEQKPQTPDWFRLTDKLRDNPDFVALAAESLLDLEDNRTWLEFKVFRQLHAIFLAALANLRDLAPVVAIELRRVAEGAVSTNDRVALDLTIKFVNTLLRASLNSRDVRTAYNVLHQYRLLCENMLLARLDEEAVQCAAHLRYYAQVAHGMSLGFVTETAAYDLARLCECAAVASAPVQRRNLDHLLQVDKESETEAQETGLRGVRKAQVKLATFYLERGEEATARVIWEDMRHERPERLRSIRDELSAVTDRYFWEVVDRGLNFDFLEPSRKAQLPTFFSWFPQLDARRSSASVPSDLPTGATS